MAHESGVEVKCVPVSWDIRLLFWRDLCGLRVRQNLVIRLEHNACRKNPGGSSIEQGCIVLGKKKI